MSSLLPSSMPSRPSPWPSSCAHVRRAARRSHRPGRRRRRLRRWSRGRRAGRARDPCGRRRPRPRDDRRGPGALAGRRVPRRRCSSCRSRPARSPATAPTRCCTWSTTRPGRGRGPPGPRTGRPGRAGRPGLGHDRRRLDDPETTRRLVHAKADSLPSPRAGRKYRNLLLDGFTDAVVEVHTGVFTDGTRFAVLQRITDDESCSPSRPSAPARTGSSSLCRCSSSPRSSSGIRRHRHPVGP